MSFYDYSSRKQHQSYSNWKKQTPWHLPTNRDKEECGIPSLDMSKFEMNLRQLLKKFFKPPVSFTLIKKQFYAVTLASLVDQFNPFAQKTTQGSQNRYWAHQTPEEVIANADTLYEERKYLDVYELLNRQKFGSIVEIQWRVARALFKMSEEGDYSKQIKKDMMQEALDILNASLTLEEMNGSVHKWIAVIIHAKAKSEGLNATIQAYPVIKDHLQSSLENNPNDITVLYMMGKLCFDLSDMSWLQRLIAKTMYGTPPTSTYEEAYKYFSKAEEIRPRFYLPNLYFLGMTCYHLKEFYRARYYLNIAACLPAKNDYETECSKKAKEQAERLGEYDLSKDALFLPTPFATPFDS